MKTIPYVKPVIIVDILGEPWPDPEKAKKPFTQREFLVNLTAERGFHGSRKGIDQVEFMCAVAKAITAVPEGQPYELEDAHHEAFARTVAQCEWNPAIAHNFIDMVKAITGA